ncbi:MAG: hypothetical protein ACLS3C_15410 [Oscillospiraceae bacterium]
MDSFAYFEYVLPVSSIKMRSFCDYVNLRKQFVISGEVQPSRLSVSPQGQSARLQSFSARRCPPLHPDLAAKPHVMFFKNTASSYHALHDKKRRLLLSGAPVNTPAQTERCGG